DAEVAGEVAADLPDPLDGLARQGPGREGAGRVAGVDAGLLDVLHDAADDGFAGALVGGLGGFAGDEVGDDGDVELGGVAQEAVDEDGGSVELGDLDRVVDVVGEGGLVGADFHAAAAQDIAGADEDRVADAVGDLDGLGE